MFHKTGHIEQAHITSGAFVHRALCLAARSTHSSAFGLMISLVGVCYGGLSRKTFFVPTLGLTISLGLGRSWLCSTSSINFLTRRNLKSLWVYLAPHDNSIQLLSTFRSKRWKNNFMVHLLLDRQKDEYLCSFLEAVPRLVISHLLHLVV